MIFNFTNRIPNMTEEEKKECESRAIQNERENEARLYGARLKCSKIPERFLSASFENYLHDTLEQEKCLETAKKYSDRHIKGLSACKFFQPSFC